MDDVGVSVDGLDYGEAFVEGTGGGVAEGIEVGSLGVCVCVYVCVCLKRRGFRMLVLLELNG